jgi:4-nitrophenyl phosphatase
MFRIDPDTVTESHSAQVRAWFDSIDTFLLDCDGVLWRAVDPVPGVAETIDVFRKNGKKVFFVTNNSTKSRDEYVSKLDATCNIKATKDEIISSAYAVSMYCKTESINKKVYVIGQQGLANELKETANVQVLGLEDNKKSFSFGEFSPDMIIDPDVQAVVAGFDNEFCYYKLLCAVTYLRYHPGCKFIATNRDKTYPDAKMLIPGGGTIISAIVAGAGREPDVVGGKPSQSLLDIIENASNGSFTRSRTCMVGDRLDTDILFGNNGKLASTLLVLTGVTSLRDAESLDERDPLRPTHVIASLGDLYKFL